MAEIFGHFSYFVISLSRCSNSLLSVIRVAGVRESIRGFSCNYVGEACLMFAHDPFGGAKAMHHHHNIPYVKSFKFIDS